MVSSCRLFRVRYQDANPRQLFKECQRKFSEKKIESIEGLELSNFVRNLTEKENGLWGEFVYESPLEILQIDGSWRKEKQAVSVGFTFLPFANKMFCIVWSGGQEAETVAVKMNKLFFDDDIILKLQFSENFIESFLSSHSHTLRMCRWDGLNIPGISKAALQGADLWRSQDPHRYDKHGDKSYVMITLLNDGWTIALSRKGTVTFYSEPTDDEKFQFIKDRIMPIIINTIE